MIYSVKNLIFMMVALFVSNTAVSQSVFDPSFDNTKPLLVKKTGGLAHLGKVNICEIYANHPKIKDRLLEVTELMNQAQKNGDLKTIAVFVRAQIPTEEIYANRIVAIDEDTRKVRIQKVELVNIYGSYKARTSTEAKVLISLVNDICQ